MDWVQAQSVPRFSGAIDPPGLGEGPNSGTSILNPDQRVLPNTDSRWGSQEGSSQGLGWQAPPPNLTGWQSAAGSPHRNSLSAIPQESAAAPGMPSRVVERAGIPLTSDATRAQDRKSSGSNSSSLLHHTQNGRASIDELAPSSYSSGTMFEAENDRGIVGAPASAIKSAAPEIHGMVEANAALPSQIGEGGAGQGFASASTTAAAGGARCTPKKKPARPRAPRKKAKPQAAPARIRRTRKVKKPRPPEVPLGADGRERAMALLRVLVNSPLSEEFRKPVIQLHPELAERYTAVVRRPIDLTTVARRLRRGTYDHAAGRLRRDTIRIFSNCEKFNLTTSQLFVGIARDLRALFESQWAEAGLPVPGETPACALRRRALLRSARYRLCWGAQLRGPLREAARQAVLAASRAALAAGGYGALAVAHEFTEDVMPELAGEGEPSDEEWTLGLFAERACLALGLRATHPPPQEPEDLGVGVLGALTGIIGLSGYGTCLALNNGNEKAGRDACAKWLFGPRQGDWLAAETASGNTSTASAAVVTAAWRALDAALSPATVLVASLASRGTEFSSVWVRPDKLVWAKQAKNVYWPAMLLWGSGTTAALREVNMCRVPPAFREELEKQQAKANKGNNRGGAVVEFFGAHEFALLKPDALRPLSTLDKSPNKSLSKNKRWRPTMDEAVNAFAALRDLDAAMYRQQTELARGFGFVVEPPPEEVGTLDTDTGTSSGDSMYGSDSECSDAGSVSAQPLEPVTTVTTATFSPTSIWSMQAPPGDPSGGGAPTPTNPMSPPPPPSRPSISPASGGAGATTAMAGATAVRSNATQGGAKPHGPKRRRKQPPESKVAQNKSQKTPGATQQTVAGTADVQGIKAQVTAQTRLPATNVVKVEAETPAPAVLTVAGGGTTSMSQRVAGLSPEVLGTGGAPAFRPTLKRPREELSRKERALEKVSRYLEKFGDAFVRSSHRKSQGHAKDKDKASPSKGKVQDPQSAPPTPAAAAVLGQTGLWGRLMGGPDNTKAPQEETESTDGEDEDVGMIDSETAMTLAERKAGLHLQKQLLEEDIENLHSRAMLQEKRLEGLGAKIPQHEALQAKRDREWKEFLEGRAPEPAGRVSAERGRSQRGGGKASSKSRALASIGSPSSNTARTPKAPAPKVPAKATGGNPSSASDNALGNERQEKSGGRAYGSSSFRGVNLNGNRWLARISQDGKKKSLGGYATEEEAAHAYDRAALQLFGPNAVTNFKGGKRVHPERGARSGGGGGGSSKATGNGNGAERGGSSQADGEPGTGTASTAAPQENGHTLQDYAAQPESPESSLSSTPAKRRMSTENWSDQGPAGSSTPSALEQDGNDQGIEVADCVVDTKRRKLHESENTAGEGRSAFADMGEDSHVSAASEAEEDQSTSTEVDAARVKADLAEAARVKADLAEAARVEAERAETARVEAERAKTARAEAARAEAARIEVARAEAARIEAARAEAARVDAARVEAARVEAARVEVARVKAARVEAARVEAARIEAARIEAARIEVARIEAARVEAARVDATEAVAAGVATAENPREIRTAVDTPTARVETPDAMKPELPSLMARFHGTQEPQTAPSPAAAPLSPPLREAVSESAGSPREDGGRESSVLGREGNRHLAASSEPALHPGYMHLFPGHGAAPGAAYGHPGYPGSPRFRIGAEGSMWPGASGHAHGHPAFNPFTAAAAYGYPFGAAGYGQAPHASGLSASEGFPSHGAHGPTAVAAAAAAAAATAAQRSQHSPLRNAGVAGYPAGTTGPPGYGIYGAHQAALFQGKSRTTEELAKSSMGMHQAGTPQGESDRSFEDSSQSGHVASAVRRTRSNQLRVSASERASLMKSPGEANAVPPPPGYGSAVMNMHARHAYAHSVQVQMAAAAQAAAMAAAAAAGGNGAERLMYNHHAAAGGLYMHEASMGHHHYRVGRSVEASSSVAGVEDGDGPARRQQDGYDLYTLAASARYSSHAQAQQQASPAESAPGSVAHAKTVASTDPEHRW